MPEIRIRDRDGDTITVAPAGPYGGGVHLHTSVPYGVELDTRTALALAAAIIKAAGDPPPLARKGEVWESREAPGRTVQVLDADAMRVEVRVLTDSDATASNPQARSSVGHHVSIGHRSWSAGLKRGYYKVKEAPADE